MSEPYTSEPHTSAFNVEFCPYGMCSGGMVVRMSGTAGCRSLVSHAVTATTSSYYPAPFHVGSRKVLGESCIVLH